MKKNIIIIFCLFSLFSVGLFFVNSVFADTVTSNCVVTNIGTTVTPGAGFPSGCNSGIGRETSNNKIAQLAIDLVNKITISCPNGIVSSDDDTSCIQNMTIPASAIYPAAVTSHILKSAAAYQDQHGVWQTGYLQCVGFVNAVTAGIYDPNGLMETDPLGYAKDYINTNIAGYPFSNNPPILEGDMPIWSATQAANIAGHIAIVVQVIDPQRGVFKVAQANWGPQGYVSFNESVTIGEISGWLHKT